METILTIGVVLIVVLWAGWSFYRTLTGKKIGCSCASNCSFCSRVNSPENVNKK